MPAIWASPMGNASARTSIGYVGKNAADECPSGLKEYPSTTIE